MLLLPYSQADYENFIFIIEPVAASRPGDSFGEGIITLMPKIDVVVFGMAMIYRHMIFSTSI